MPQRRPSSKKSAPRVRRRAGAPPLDARVADLRALAHPLRLRILETFAEGPRTTKQVAELLGEPPTRLYHHVAALERAGFLVLKETRRNRGAVERWYESLAQRMQVSHAPSQGAIGGSAPDAPAAKRAVVATILDQARREMTAAIPRPGQEPALLTRLILVAPEASIAEVRRRLFEAVSNIHRDLGIDDPTRLRDGEERWAITLAFAPVWPRPKRAKKAAD